MNLQLFKGDLTTLSVDAIVNAANNSLLGGGGVDGAIHRAAGPELLVFNKTLGGCQTGEAKISPGFNLKAKHVISTVGPVWQGGNHGEASLLRNCYLNSLKLAVEKGLRSVAFPSISTGVYGYPLKKAAIVALSAVESFLMQHPGLQVTFVCFNDEALELYQSLLATSLRKLTLADYENVYQLWTGTAGMGMRTLDDSETGIAKFLNRNPNTNFVAVQNNRLVGVILSGHDGRRGYIYHAAVKEECRGSGTGKRLLETALAALKEEGIHKAALVVFKSNAVGNSFWERENFMARTDLVYRNKSLNDENL